MSGLATGAIGRQDRITGADSHGRYFTGAVVGGIVGDEVGKRLGRSLVSGVSAFTKTFTQS